MWNSGRWIKSRNPAVLKMIVIVLESPESALRGRWLQMFVKGIYIQHVLLKYSVITQDISEGNLSSADMWNLSLMVMMKLIRVFCVPKAILLKAVLKKRKKKLHGLSPRANYTNRATAACRRSDCQLLRIEGATWSA
jgi:hypothetical protein